MISYILCKAEKNKSLYGEAFIGNKLQCLFNQFNLIVFSLSLLPLAFSLSLILRRALGFGGRFYRLIASAQMPTELPNWARLTNSETGRGNLLICLPRLVVFVVVCLSPLACCLFSFCHCAASRLFCGKEQWQWQRQSQTQSRAEPEQETGGGS